jgi:hypothetical protein
MSENLSNFLVDLASDADRMARFRANPFLEMAEAGLTDAERSAVLAQDSRELNQALASPKQRITHVLNKKGPKKGGKKKGTKKGGAKKGSKKGGARKSPAKRKGTR